MAAAALLCAKGRLCDMVARKPDETVDWVIQYRKHFLLAVWDKPHCIYLVLESGLRHCGARSTEYSS